MKEEDEDERALLDKASRGRKSIIFDFILLS